MQTRIASIKETGEELSPAEWQRFDAAVAELKAERERNDLREGREKAPQAESSTGQAVA